MKKIIIAASPMVGIFWIGPKGIISFGEPVKSVPSVGGFKDSPYNHIDKWAQVVSVYPQFRDKEYYDIPRGRILFVEATRLFRLISSREICSNKGQVSAVCREFSLPMRGVELVADMHYELEPDFGDDDDEV